jgi:predicted transcriptional regulator
MHDLGSESDGPTIAADGIVSAEDLPLRIRELAVLRGLGYSLREIGKQFGVTPQAVSLMLQRHRRVLKSLGGVAELRGLSARAVNALGRHGVTSRAEARRRGVLELLRNERNCGRKTLAEIDRWMAETEAVAVEEAVEFEHVASEATA